MIYTDVAENAVLVQKIAEEAVEAAVAERDQNKKVLTGVLIGVGVAVAAAVAAATVILLTKNKDGERRGKVLIMKIKSKLPCKKAEECCCECDCEEAVEEACECAEEAGEEAAEETKEEVQEVAAEEVAAEEKDFQ